MRNLVVPALAAICLSGAIAPAAMAETVTVEVTHADLDLTTKAGQKVLESRVAAAIKTACAKPDTRSLKAAGAWQSCKTSAASDAAGQLEKSIEFARL